MKDWTSQWSCNQKELHGCIRLPRNLNKTQSESTSVGSLSSVCVYVCIGHLAKKGGFQLCCGVAGVKKLTQGHLEVKNKSNLKMHISSKAYI